MTNKNLNILKQFLNMLKNIAPKKFLCYYSLTSGAIIGCSVLIVVTLICTIAMITQVVLMKNCRDCTQYVWRNAYSFSITGIIYCVIMLALHGWAIWGINKKKSSVLLSWVVITAMWLSQTFFLLIILICIHISNINFIAWIICFILGLISICILTYFVLIVFGLWLEIKGNQQRNLNVTISNNN